MELEELKKANLITSNLICVSHFVQEMRLKMLHDVPVISKQSPDVKEVQESVHS